MSQTRNKFSPEIRTCVVRLVLDQEAERSSWWSTIQAIAPKIGCSAQTLNEWIKRGEIGSGRRGGIPTQLAEKASPSRHRSERRWRAALERENRELRQANEILRKASAYFDPLSAVAGNRLPGSGTELDRRSKTWSTLRARRFATSLTITGARMGSSRSGTGSANRPVPLLRSPGAAGGPGAPVGPRPARGGLAARDRARLRCQL